jgi:hypothetical protein
MQKAVLVCTLAVAAALAAVGAPSPFLDVFGFQACEGQFVFNGSVPATTVKPVGTDSIRDAKHKGVTDKLEEGVKQVGGDPKNKSTAKNIRDTVGDVFKLDLDAVTWTERTWNWTVTRRADNTVNLLTVTWKTLVVILLPANADAQLTNHETGHRQIEENLKDLAGARFGAEKAKIVDKVITNAEIEAILAPVAAKLMKIGDEAQSAYDSATQNGTQGGENQQAAATTAFNAAVANNP